MSANIQAVTDEAFEQEVIKSATPVVVDFWAEWCGPCKALSPKIDQVAAQFQGKIRVLKMNVDDNPRTPSKFGIRGIPTLIVFKGGKVVDQAVGDQSIEDLKSLLSRCAS
ncbi:MAG: thioredoxin [Deltaproteobacteria bacterium]|nr:thioredoxin [Deltaproteobacteria bacterium]